MGSALIASAAAPIAGNLATSIGSKVLGKKAGGLLGTAAEMGASAYGGNIGFDSSGAIGRGGINRDASNFIDSFKSGRVGNDGYQTNLNPYGQARTGQNKGTMDFLSKYSQGTRGYDGMMDEGGGVLGDLASKAGGWFKDKDNQAFLYDAGLTALPWLMDMFSEEEVINDMGGGSPPPVATGGPGYGGGSAGGQYGVGWGFDGPNRAGYKPGRV